MQHIDCEPFFNLTIDMLCICSFDGYFVRLNPAWEAILGFSKEELERVPFLDFVHPEDKEHTQTEFNKLVTGTPAVTYENRHLSSDGTYHWLLWTATGCKETGYVYAIARDITAKKVAQAKVVQLTEELMKSNADLEQFAYVASHDLQEPLRMISSYCQLLERRYAKQLDDTAKEFIKYAVDGTKRMKTLINDLLMYSRISRSSRIYGLVDLNEVIDTALSNLRFRIEDTAATITHDDLPVVYGDLVGIERVFQNLISNAMKFQKPDVKPVIHVGALPQQDDKVTLFVRDNGIGIDPKHFNKLFIIFQRLHSQDEYAGTGMGLAIVKKIVEQHKGQVWIESEVGNGTTFFFALHTKRWNNGTEDN